MQNMENRRIIRLKANLKMQRYTPHKAVRAADVPKADEYYAKLKEGMIR